MHLRNIHLFRAWGESLLRESRANVFAALSTAVVVAVVVASVSSDGEAQPAPFVVTSVNPTHGVWSSQPGSFINIGLSAAVASIPTNGVIVRGSLSGRRTGVVLGGGTAGLSFIPDTPFLPGERIDVSVTSALTSATNAQSLKPRVSRHHVRAGTNVGAFGTFLNFGAPPAATNPAKSVAAVDLDGDGDIDFMDASGGGEIRFWENIGNGVLAAFPSEVTFLPGTSSRLHAVDLDDDGLPEVWESRSPQPDRLWKSAGFGSYVEVPIFSHGSTQARSADFNGDGRPDIVTISPTGTRIWLNDGALFASVTPRLLHLTPQNAVATGDVDADGDFDILLAGTALTVLRNEGYGNFTMPSSTFAMGQYRALECHDMNADGRDDIVAVAVAGIGGATATGVYLSVPNSGLFQRISSPINAVPGTTLAVGDLDGDGRPDLAIGGTGSPAVSVWINTGTGSMQSAGNGLVGTAPGSLALADIDGDGVLDLVYGRTDGQSSWHRYVPFDGTSQIALASPPPAEYPSITSQPVTVMSLLVSDLGSTDSLPTVMQRLVVDLTGSTADASLAAWTLSGVGLLSVPGAVVGQPGSQSVVFDGISVAIQNSSSTVLSIGQLIPATAGFLDGSVFNMEVRPDTVAASPLGSQFDRSGANAVSSSLTWSVSATELRFTALPPALTPIGVHIYPEVAFTDAFGNVDFGVNGELVSLWRGTSLLATSVAVAGRVAFANSAAILLAPPAATGLVLRAADHPTGQIDFSTAPALTPLFELIDPLADAVLEPGPAVERDAISSVQSVNVVAFDFRIRDLGAAGGGPTMVDTVVLSLEGSTALGSDALWSLMAFGQAAPMPGTVSGTPGNELVTFQGNWPMSQGTGLTFQLLCMPVTSPAGTKDRDKWLCRISPSSFNFVAGGFHAGQQPLTNGSGMAFSVSATELRLAAPLSPLLYPTDPVELTILYTDANGNVDRDVGSGDRITATRSDGGAVLQGLSRYASEGRAHFTGSRALVLGSGAQAPFSLVFRDNQGGGVTFPGPGITTPTVSLAASSRCDINVDGIVDVVDVQFAVNLILGQIIAEFPGEGDANGDGLVDVVDVQTIVNKVLSAN